MASIVKRGDKWLVQVRYRGVYASKHFYDKKAGEAWGRTQQVEIERGNIKSTADTMPTLVELLDRYKEKVSSQKKSERTEGYIIERLKKEEFALLPADQITTEMMEDFRNRRYEEVSKRTVQYDLILLKHCYKKAWKSWGFKKLKRENPVIDLDMPKVQNERKRRLSQSEMLKFLGCLNDYVAGGIEFRLYIKWQLESGLRRMESINMTWNDVDMDADTVFLRNTKNGEDRYAPINPWGMNILRQLNAFNKFKPFQNLLPDFIDGHWTKLLKKAGIKDFRLHDLRRECLSTLSEHGYTSLQIQEVSGHKEERMVKRYCVGIRKSVGDKMIAEAMM